MTNIKRRGYAQEWPAYDAAQVSEKRVFQSLLRELCSCVEQPEQTTGRPRLPFGDMIFCLAYKVYSTFAARRFMTDLADAHDKGLIAKLPHFNSLSHYLRMESLTPVLTRLIEVSCLPLESFEADFAIDSTGFSVRRYARWVDERTLEEKTKKEWVKVHLICGVRTNVVAGVIVTSRREQDSPYFGRLVAAAARHFKVSEVSADKAYLAVENMRHALLAGAIPFIPFRSNCHLDADWKSTFWKRMLYLYRYRQREFASHYNKRNNVETTFSMIKAKFGGALRSKSTHSQINEALCKVLCHNLCVLIQSMYEVGITPQFSAAGFDIQEPPVVTDKVIGGGRIIAAGKDKSYENTTGVRGADAHRKTETARRLNQLQLNLFEEGVG
jgi:transposase